MEVKYDIVKPNVYSVDNVVYFSLGCDDAIPLAKDVDRIAGRNIGDLKVKKSDLELISDWKFKLTDREHTIPLKDYLDAYDRAHQALGFQSGVTNREGNLLGFSFNVCADTFRSRDNIKTWRALKRELSEPERVFDRYDEEQLIWKVDRTKTLENMRRVYQELDVKIPDNIAHFDVISFRQFSEMSLGVVAFHQIKSETNKAIEKAKAELIDKLKEIEGPALSFDVPSFVKQIGRINFGELTDVVNSYGDILFNPGWPDRLFRIDP